MHWDRPTPGWPACGGYISSFPEGRVLSYYSQCRITLQPNAVGKGLYAIGQTFGIMILWVLLPRQWDIL